MSDFQWDGQMENRVYDDDWKQLQFEKLLDAMKLLTDPKRIKKMREERIAERDALAEKARQQV